MFFKHKKNIKVEENQEAEDARVYSSPWDFSENCFSMSFENGISVIITPNTPFFVKVRVLTPTLDITHRFDKLYRPFGITPDLLLKILNAVSSLPNVYTINKIPDSCFDFKCNVVKD